MTLLFLVLATFILLAAMLYLTLAVNEFERQTRELSAVIEKRYTLPEPEAKNTVAPAKKT